MAGVSPESWSWPGRPGAVFFEWFKIQASGLSDHRRERRDSVCLFWLGNRRATAAQAQELSPEREPTWRYCMHVCVCACAGFSSFRIYSRFLSVSYMTDDSLVSTKPKDGWMEAYLQCVDVEWWARLSIHSNRCHSRRGKMPGVPHCSINSTENLKLTAITSVTSLNPYLHMFRSLAGLHFSPIP